MHFALSAATAETTIQTYKTKTPTLAFKRQVYPSFFTHKMLENPCWYSVCMSTWYSTVSQSGRQEEEQEPITGEEDS